MIRCLLGRSLVPCSGIIEAKQAELLLECAVVQLTACQAPAPEWCQPWRLREPAAVITLQLLQSTDDALITDSVMRTHAHRQCKIALIIAAAAAAVAPSTAADSDACRQATVTHCSRCGNESLMATHPGCPATRWPGPRPTPG